MSKAPLLWILAVVAMLAAQPAAGRDAGDPIRMAWVEGDVAGISSILSADGTSTIGFIDYHQHRRDDLLEIVRVARFSDGSSDEERVNVRTTVNWLIDPIIRMFAPDTYFFVNPGTQPGLTRFDGPRNCAEQKMRIE